MKSFGSIVGMLGFCIATMTGCDGSSVAAQEERVAPGEEAVTLYVAAHTVSCVGEGQRECLLVREDPTRAWSYFYDAIAGFEYRPGYTYTLRVAVRKIENPPADGSSRAYRLLRILATQRA